MQSPPSPAATSAIRVRAEASVLRLVGDGGNVARIEALRSSHATSVRFPNIKTLGSRSLTQTDCNAYPIVKAERTA